MTHATGAADLPSPDVRPGTDVVIFDGQCGICTRQVQNLARWDRAGRLAYLSLHDERVAQQYPDLRREQLMREMVIVDRRGRRHAGAYAVRHLTSRLPRLWWLAPLLYFPGAMLLAKPLYQWIAKNRYRLSGKESCQDGTCELHRNR